MRSAFILFLLTAVSFTAAANDSVLVITGPVKRHVFFTDPIIKTWFLPGYNNYHPADSTIDKVRSALQQHASLKVAVIFGSWCGDSKKEVPRLVKVLDVIGVDTANVNFIGVDRKKKSPRRDILHYKISRVPTVVITYTLGEKIIQMGRITEHPKVSFEDEILKIIDSRKP